MESLLISSSDRKLPLEVYRQLVNRLYQTPWIVMVGAGCCIAMLGGMIAYHADDLGIAALTIASVSFVLFGLLRCASLQKQISFDKIVRAESIYYVAALGSTSAVGVLGARALVVSDIPIVHLLALALGMATMAIAQRNYFRPRLVALQLVSIVLPGAFAMFLHGGHAYWTLGIGSIILSLMIGRTAFALSSDAQYIIMRDRDLRDQNRRFDAALNNMAQGLCMFDADGHLLVCNEQYLSIYGFSPEVVRPGTTLTEILQHSIDVGNHTGVDSEMLQDSFIEKVMAEEKSTFLNELADGRTIALSHGIIDTGGWVTTHEDITERRRAVAKIEYMARHDALTDLPNRAFFHEQLTKSLNGLSARTKVAVLCLDLDRFKPVNDTLGHPVGDVLLKQVAERISAAVLGSDSLARIGGDEFAIIHSSVDNPESALVLAERIISEMEQPFFVGSQQIGIGMSIGISIAPDDSLDAHQLLKNADLALYQAKADGESQCRLFLPEMSHRMQARRTLELDLRRAVVDDEFEVYYQPLVSTSDGQIMGFEALLRWNHPSKGMVLPSEFIPLAEDIGLIGQIGEWVLHRACSEAANWPAGIRISVNLSPIQFRSGDVVRIVMNALAASGIDPGRLELEITEGVLVADMDDTLETLHSLRKLGVRFAMDDFGTGYSSLSYLHLFPFSSIKIDRSFVKDIASGSQASSIIRAVIDLGKSLGMSTTAEGIETADQLELIKAEGCSEVQGFHLGRPMSSASALKLVQKVSRRAGLEAA